jgi:hypothetical protein
LGQAARLARAVGYNGNGKLMARLVQTSLTLGFLIALSVVAPSFKAGDLIKLLGVGTVAIGFAFQNILQNFLAGILSPFAGTVSARRLHQCYGHRRNGPRHPVTRDDREH